MWGKSPTTGGSAETETSSSTHTQMSVMMTIGIYKNEERGKASSVATALSHLDGFLRLPCKVRTKHDIIISNAPN